MRRNLKTQVCCLRRKSLQFCAWKAKWREEQAVRRADVPSHRKTVISFTFLLLLIFAVRIHPVTTELIDPVPWLRMQNVAQRWKMHLVPMPSSVLLAANSGNNAITSPLSMYEHIPMYLLKCNVLLKADLTRCIFHLPTFLKTKC